MSETKVKVLCVKRFGWKRIARNTERFGWTLDEAEEETTTTHETTYEGEVVGDKIYVKPHTTTSTKVRVWLTFWRNKDDFKNLMAIRLLELVYNILFYIRRIVGFFLPVVGVLSIIVVAFSNSTGGHYDDETTQLSMYLLAAFASWISLIICEGILSRIAGAILKRK